MATEAGTAYVAIIPSARGFAKELRKSIGKEFAGSKLDQVIADALAGTTVSVPVRPEVRPGDIPDELPVRPGREPVLPVRLDPLTAALQADVRRELAGLTREALAVDVGADTDRLRTDVSAAVSAVESTLTADIPTEPAGRREYERQLREQVAEVSRTVRAHITADVDVDLDKPLRDGKIDVAGETVGRSLASSIMGSLASGISTIAGPVTFVGLAVAAAVTAPLIGATIAGGILTAIGGGVIALGILGVKDDPRFKSAAADLGKTMKDTLSEAAGPLLGTEAAPGPLLRAMETLKQLVIDVGPSLKEMFEAIGPYLPVLAEGIAAFVKEAMPGMVEAVKAAGPLIEVIALNMGPLGESVGQFLTVMAELGPAAAGALNVIFFLLNHVIGVAGSVIYVLGAAFGGLFQNVKDARDGIAAAWATITAAFSGGGRDVQRLTEAAVGAVLRFFHRLWDGLAGGTRNAVSNVTGYFGRLPGQIRSAVGNLDNVLYGAGRAVIQGLINGLRAMFGPLEGTLNWVTNSIPNWKGPPARDRRLLEPAGTAIMGGLIRGIGGQVPSLRSQLGSVTDLIAGTPLAAAASAPYGVMATAPAPAPLVAEWVGGDGDPIMQAIREHTRIYYGGDPTVAFGS